MSATMENYVIKTYSPDKGFEEIQAMLYNSVVKKYNGQEVTAAQIKQRLEREIKNNNIDFEGIRYAFEYEKPIAYIQYRKSSLGIYIGYPWSIEGTPDTLKRKLYQDLKTYIREKFPDEPIFLGYIDEKFTDVHKYIEQLDSFQVDDWYGTYETTFDQLEKLEKNSFTFREGSDQDFDLLLELALEDSNLKSMGKESLENYFKNKIFNDKHIGIIFENDIAIASTAFLQNFQDSEATLYRYIALRGDDDKGLEPLFSYMATYAKKNGLNPKARFFTGNTTKTSAITEKVEGKHIGKQVRYKLA